MTEIPLKDLGPCYAFCDPHGGRSNALKHVASRAAIVVGAQDYLGRIFILHAWADRVPTHTLMDKMHEVNEDFHLKSFGGEANGLQALFQDAVIRDATLRGRKIPLVPVYQPTHQEKDNRIRSTLQPLIARGKLFLMPHMHELRHEIVTFPMNPRKDLIDATASLCRLMPIAAPRREREARDDMLAKYLRDTGAPAWYIEETMRSRQW